MPMKITTADERLAAGTLIKSVVVGPSGVGKTYLAKSLNPKSTLFLDGEAGTNALGTWAGATVSLRDEAGKMGLHPWELCRGLACLLAGPDFSDYDISAVGRVPGPYSPEAHATYEATIGKASDLFAGIRTVFMDSITVASRWSFAYANSQPEALSEKTGKKDTRGAYGLHGQQMIKWLTQMQHASVNIIMVGILDRHEDELHRVTYVPQIEGSKVGRELPGIFDEVVTLSRFTANADGTLEHDMAGGATRAFVCGPNPWGLPGKSRAGTLGVIEEPNLAKLLSKIANGARHDATATASIPTPAALPANADGEATRPE